MVKVDGEGRRLLAVEYNASGLPTKVELGSGGDQFFEYDDGGASCRRRINACGVGVAHDDLGNQVEDQRDGRGVRHVYDFFDLDETVLLGRFATRYERTGGRLTVVDPTGSSARFPAPWSWTDREDAFQRHEGDQPISIRRPLPDQGQFPRPRRAVGTVAKVFLLGGRGPAVREDSERGPISYRYNADHRLVGEDAPGEGPRAFRYDAAGNLVEKPDLTGVSIVDGDRLASANGDTFEYDARGNVGAARCEGDHALFLRLSRPTRPHRILLLELGRRV